MKLVKLKIISIYIICSSDCRVLSRPFCKMIFTTQLELNITIKDINAIYSTTYDQMLLDHAKLMYEGKCRDGQYVKSIDSLVKRSLPNLIRRDLSAKIRVYILVEATVIRYDQYDIITGMKVIKIIPAGKISNFDMVECRNDHVVALMKIQKGIEDFKIGDIIPIGVGQSMYKIGNAHILVNGYPFLPYSPDEVHYAIGKLSPDVKHYYQTMIINLLERQLERKQSLDKKRWDMFSTLLHPLKKQSKISGGLNILDIELIQNGVFKIDHQSNLSELKIIHAEPDKDARVITTPLSEAKTSLTRMAFQFVKWIETINDFTEIYSSDESFNQVKYIWDAYDAHKL